MPWTAGDALKHTKKAKTTAQKRAWALIATKVLAEYGDEGKAIRIANAAMRKKGKR